MHFIHKRGVDSWYKKKCGTTCLIWYTQFTSEAKYASKNIQQDQDAHRCDKVKVLSYTNSLRAFQKLISGLTWSYTHYQAALILRRWCQVLASPFSNFGCERVGLGLGILET